VAISIVQIHGAYDLPLYAFIPLDELLGFIVDKHFPDPQQRRDLHAKIRDSREQLRNTGEEFQATMGRLGTLNRTCKNPLCASQMRTDVKAAEGQRINYGPEDMTCFTCGQTFAHDGSDFKLSFPE